jgi:hypothetical protein
MQLYGLVQGFGYVIGLNDFKDHATFASTACWGSETPHNLPKPLDDDLEDLFEISGLWVRNDGDHHEVKLQNPSIDQPYCPGTSVPTSRSPPDDPTLIDRVELAAV